MSLIDERAKPLLVNKKDGIKYYRDRNGNVRIYV